MKNFLVYVALASNLFAACQNASPEKQGKSSEETSTPDNEKEEKKNVSKRDFGIAKTVAYSDLFLDSAAMEKFILNTKTPDGLARRMRSFYNARNYGFAWFSTTGLTEQARAFWNLHDYVTTYNGDTALRDAALQKRMDALTAEDSLKATASPAFVQTELTLTQHFIRYIQNNYDNGYVKREEAERFVPIKKVDAFAMADSLLNKKHKDNRYFEDVHEPYKKLKEKLTLYYNVAKSGGWPQIQTTAKSFKQGMQSPAIAVIKKRLQLSGDMPGADTSQLFNDTLTLAVQRFQQSLGLTPTGEVNAQLIKDLNVTAKRRLAQILMNMDRMRWLPTEPSGQLMVVNIPEFILHVYEGKKKAFDMNVVVGKEGHNTVSFSGDLSTVVFAPYWNVPPSIVRKEILPKLSPAYLASQRMEIVGREGGLPKIRQLPGEKNSLGKVKFPFPNSFNIYFHDTQAKSLFSRDKRAYSHGCIRLSEPQKMAEYLLRDNPEWTTGKIAEAMNGDKEKSVRLAKPVPVLITYYTAWVDDNGLLNFRDDIYKHDSDLAKKMFL